jgi:putative transposase
MMKVYLYRLYPTKVQKTVLNHSLDLCRWIYNETLTLRKNAWELELKKVNYYDLKKTICQEQVYFSKYII